jgi:hypothetical protein
MLVQRVLQTVRVLSVETRPADPVDESASKLTAQVAPFVLSPEGRQTYAKRKVTTEPVFGNIKANLRCRRFSGRGMQAALSQWRLICSVHNLLKVRNHRLAITWADNFGAHPPELGESRQTPVKTCQVLPGRPARKDSASQPCDSL